MKYHSNLYIFIIIFILIALISIGYATRTETALIVTGKSYANQKLDSLVVKFSQDIETTTSNDTITITSNFIDDQHATFSINNFSGYKDTAKVVYNITNTSKEKKAKLNITPTLNNNEYFDLEALANTKNILENIILNPQETCTLQLKIKVKKVAITSDIKAKVNVSIEALEVIE